MFGSTRWSSTGKVLKWLKANRIRLFRYLDEQKLLCTPSKDWWIVVEIVNGLVDRIETTFTSMQGMKPLVSEQQQRRLLVKLQYDIQTRCHIKGPMTMEETIEFSDAVKTDGSYGFWDMDFSVTKQDLLDAIDEVSAFVQISMDELRSSDDDHDKSIHTRVVSTIANFSLQITRGISKYARDVTI